MNKTLNAFATTWALVGCALLASGAEPTPPLTWSQLPDIPDKEGFAAPFVGASNGALIVAGGANFPNGYPWEGGKKLWYDSVFVLEKPNGKWKTGHRLPRRLAYGVSINTDKGLLCVGGGDSEKHLTDVFLLEWIDGKIKTTEYPALPRPCAFASGARVGNRVYLAGGIETPTATQAMNTFWALNLGKIQDGWKELPTWPGPERMLAVAGSAKRSFFLISGTNLHPDADGKPERTYLRDGYRYSPKSGWEKISDIPAPAIASPSPAPVVNRSKLLVLCGDDGSKVGSEPLSKHPGFPKRTLAYDAKKDSWSDAGKLPFSIVTVPVTRWKGHFVIANGEARPGVRSPSVWWADPRAKRKKGSK